MRGVLNSCCQKMPASNSKRKRGGSGGEGREAPLQERPQLQVTQAVFRHSPTGPRTFFYSKLPVKVLHLKL